MTNPFFKNTGPYEINQLLQSIGLKHQNFQIDKVNDIKDLNSSKINEITFFHSKKYAELARLTKASYCIMSSLISCRIKFHSNLIISSIIKSYIL